MHKLRLIGISFLFLSLPASLFAQAMAQQPTAMPAQDSSITASKKVSPAAQSNQPQRIMPGDLLSIKVNSRPAIRTDARVDARGMIRMPLIVGDMQAVCRTESELAQIIAVRYQIYLKAPQVSVSIQESSSEFVVIGGVIKPGKYQFQRRVCLQELLALAGVPTNDAKGVVNIHRQESATCDASGGAIIRDPGAVPAIIRYDLKEVMRGADADNPYLQSGDIVSVRETNQIYVVGNVEIPRAIDLQSPLTVLEAIAIAGGTLRKSKIERVLIIRSAVGFAGSYKTVIPVNLKAISKGEAADILLQANDIVEVYCDGRCPSRAPLIKPLSGLDAIFR